MRRTLFFFCFIRRPPPISTRTDPFFPYTTLFRSRIGDARPIPALHQFAPRLLARLGRLDHAMPLIGMDRLAGAARRQCLRGVALPVLMLPAYGGDLGRAVPLREAAERRAGLDRLQLLRVADKHDLRARLLRSDEHTSELQSLMRISYAVFCFKK